MQQQILYDHGQHFNNVPQFFVMLLFNMHRISKVQIFGYLLLLTVVNMYKHRGEIVIQSLQGSAVTQTVLDGQTIHPVLPVLPCKLLITTLPLCLYMFTTVNY